VDSQGNVYGTTVMGGSIVNTGTVWEILKGSNTITTLAAFTGPDGQEPTGSLTLDTQGNLYGTTTGAGPSQYGTLWEIANGTSTLSTLASFGGVNGATPYAGLTIGADGQLYGTTIYGGAGGDGTVFEYQIATPEPSSLIMTVVISTLAGAAMLLRRRFRLPVARR
jgi:uncharacterized repeat protein (TIGR03803 family)